MKPSQYPILECLSVPRGPNHAYRTKEKNRLLVCMVITGITMLLEFFGGLWTNSLALLSDSAHMFSHLFSLGISFVAIWFATKEPDEVRSYGFYRAEILAAFLNGITLAFIVLWIVYDAILRILNPTPIATTEMLIIATIGLIVNLVSALILKSVSGHDLNIKSAFFHLISDTASSVGIIVAGLLIATTGKLWLDPVASLLIALLILRWSLQLMKESVHILLEATPKHLSRKEIVSAIKKEIPEIVEIDHIHIWELTSGMSAFTAHICVPDISISQSDQIKKRLNAILKERFGITHTNLQFECHKGNL